MVNYRPTLYSCYRGYVVQAIINNLAPVLFTIFVFQYNIPVQKIALLIVLNFCTQIGADIFAVFFIDRIGYRTGALMAHIFATLGLWCMAFLPGLLPSPFVGLAISMMICALGGGLLEVLVSPIVDLIPSDAKAAGMSLLHSFYCWGQLAVVLFSTLLLRALGSHLWPILPLLWSLVPIYNFFAFRRVPMPPMPPAEHVHSANSLFKNKFFWLCLILMVATGASEQGMSQWSSAFAETGLGVDKVVGDLLGPCLFAVFMAIGRTVYGLWGHKIPLRKALLGCSVLGVACYLTAALAPWPLLSLAGCAVCGLAVSLLWPGMFSLASERLHGGTPMFGIMAIAGDVGCAFGPWLVGTVAGSAGGAQQLGTGILAGTVFPLIMFLGVLALRSGKSKVK